ncbi:tetratricopeptide repeat-containing diguanylate cyclase [Colwellia piezophila]|uniref:tetratricopeptide repeat-containing diguanylate cyclase n=1 Tax=Colwellia piezophila TaxID=211668 RepID=UPI0003809510|nr:GGDEF domain-containing protein [Colwellia piezophila]
MQQNNSPLQPMTTASVIFLTLCLTLIPCLLLVLINIALANQQTSHIADALMMSDDITKKLNLADNSRLRDPKLFRQLLAELIKKKPHFTAVHQQFFNYLQAYHFAFIGEHDQAEQTLKNILRSEANTLLKFRVNHTLINLSAINHKWADGLRYVADNNAMIDKIKDKRYIQHSLLATAMFYLQLKQYDLALKHISLLEQHDVPLFKQCFIKQYSLEVKLELATLSVDNDGISKAIRLCVKAENKIGANSIRLYQAELYLQKNQPDQALQLLLPYRGEIKATLFPMLIASANNMIARAYFQLDDMGNAKNYAMTAMLLNKHNTGIKRGRDSYQVLYQVAEQEKNFVLALSYFKQYAQLDKAFLDEVKAKHLAFQLAEHDSAEQANKIKLLNEINNVLVTKQALSETKVRNVQLLITILVLLLIILSVWGAGLWQRHKRVRLLAESDDLTGIYNRRHFNYVSVSALRYCKTARQDLSVIMFDLDNFKLVNDSFGHACGDWTLKEAIKACLAIGKNSDVLARLGGEEFCLLLPSTNIDEAYIRAEACRIAIENIITEASGFDFSITASFGVTDIKRSGFRLTDLLKDADSAMYIAKQAGRNQVMLFPLQKNSVTR